MERRTHVRIELKRCSVLVPTIPNMHVFDGRRIRC